MAIKQPDKEYVMSFSLMYLKITNLQDLILYFQLKAELLSEQFWAIQ